MFHGLRPATAAHTRATDCARQYSSEHIRTKAEIWAIWDDAIPAFELNASARQLLDFLMRVTQDKDWSDPKRPPVAYPSNRMICTRLCISERTLARAANTLIEAGLITMNDSATRKRYCASDGTAYGFNLAPIAVRYSELQAIAASMSAERQQRHELVSLIVATRTAIKQKLMAAADDHPDVDDWPDLAGHLDQIVDRYGDLAKRPRRHIRADLKVLGQLLAELQLLDDRVDAARDAYDDASCSENVTAAPDNFDGSYINNREFHPQTCQRSGAASGRKLGGKSAPAVEVELVLDACPILREYHFGQVRTMYDLIDAAAKLRPNAGIKQEFWADTCANIGRAPAAILLAHVLQRQADGEITRSAGGLYRNLCDRYAAGGLNLRRQLQTQARKNYARQLN
ncbi:plasmid replication protein RepC [Aminobacter sp. MET-1]|uniref:plasmid replication protein RepC n=1 Tax=Aminobacter sp. MET-1 TaxID=2951085 RepID=UPI00226AACC7|nr:plasmid replication protein RepC [Aminobacter sp. MET-1]MCX8571099.1 replication initiation protein RepC [Aminobacter sp. MET-1]MCX8573232.1 replication initiation protein RepC [Aminobacter sp. MET-1]